MFRLICREKLRHDIFIFASAAVLTAVMSVCVRRFSGVFGRLDVLISVSAHMLLWGISSARAASGRRFAGKERRGVLPPVTPAEEKEFAGASDPSLIGTIAGLVLFFRAANYCTDRELAFYGPLLGLGVSLCFNCLCFVNCFDIFGKNAFSPPAEKKPRCRGRLKDLPHRLFNVRGIIMMLLCMLFMYVTSVMRRYGHISGRIFYWRFVVGLLMLPYCTVRGIMDILRIFL